MVAEKGIKTDISERFEGSEISLQVLIYNLLCVSAVRLRRALVA